MNNREFYEKWGKSEELKVIVNAIVFRGLQMYSVIGDDLQLSRDGVPATFIDDVLSTYSGEDPAAYIRHIECYRDLIRMSDGFIKNVIKKVL